MCDSAALICDGAVFICDGAALIYDGAACHGLCVRQPGCAWRHGRTTLLCIPVGGHMGDWLTVCVPCWAHWKLYAGGCSPG